jgi:hypothetical protein
MTSPWPVADLSKRQVMCCLCFGTFSFEELSKTDDGYLTDVCIPCRETELKVLEEKRKRERKTQPSEAPPGPQEDEASKSS